MKKNTCVCVYLSESLCYTAEINTTLELRYTSIKIFLNKNQTPRTLEKEHIFHSRETLFTKCILLNYCAVVKTGHLPRGYQKNLQREMPIMRTPRC